MAANMYRVGGRYNNFQCVNSMDGPNFSIGGVISIFKYLFEITLGDRGIL